MMTDDVLLLRPYRVKMQVRSVPKPFHLVGTIIASSLTIARAKAIDDVVTRGMEWNSLHITFPQVTPPLPRFTTHYMNGRRQ